MIRLGFAPNKKKHSDPPVSGLGVALKTPRRKNIIATQVQREKEESKSHPGLLYEWKKSKTFKNELHVNDVS
jgi:hypothetical protein